MVEFSKLKNARFRELRTLGVLGILRGLRAGRESGGKADFCCLSSAQGPGTDIWQFGRAQAGFTLRGLEQSKGQCFRAQAPVCTTHWKIRGFSLTRSGSGHKDLKGPVWARAIAKAGRNWPETKAGRLVHTECGFGGVRTAWEGFVGCSEESTCQCWRSWLRGFGPRVGRISGGDDVNPLQHSYLENPMDRGA